MANEEQPPARTVVYLVVEFVLVWKGTAHGNAADGITHRAFLSRDRAVAYARELVETNRAYVAEVVERVLEEAEE